MCSKNQEKSSGSGPPSGLDSRLEGPRRHELRHQDGAFVAPQRRLPGVEESHDVWVLQRFQHLHLLSEPLTLRLVQAMSLRGSTRSINARINKVTLSRSKTLKSFY